jgi:hypothetical protein
MNNLHVYPRYRAAHQILHLLWTKAAAEPGYSREEWNALQEAVDNIAREGLGAPEPESYVGPEDPTQATPGA